MRLARYLFSTLLVLFIAALRADTPGEHPRLYASNKDRGIIREKIRAEPWATASWERLRASIDPYVDRHQHEPAWILSRLAMYWKHGERYTQCYLKAQNWDRGEGDAPVPTVRLPGMRTWNDFANVPLEERLPYNETGDMLARSRKNPEAPAVVVPYKQSGHLVRINNAEILGLAEKASFAHWITGEEKYARFAADIFWAWLLGTYYMQPPLDPERSTGGPGGYEPGGIAGYYDYEQIHDDLMMRGATIYDFLYDYLAARPDKHLAVIGKNFSDVSATVFKRFIDIGFVRGGREGNWNVNGWNVLMRGILVLDANTAYADGRGREYYLEYYTKKSTAYHDALPAILKGYDSVTGLWPESPGYGLGTINTVLDLAIPIHRAGVDTIGGNPMMQKAALASLAWWDARGNMVVFGDTRGGPGSFVTFERLLTYYTWKGDAANAAIVAAALNKGVASGQYSRVSGWEGICVNVAKIPSSADLPAARTAYSAAHRHLILKNLNDEKHGLMLTLYGGSKGNHLSPNGLALQLYGKGWALAPDASAYESYWSQDAAYHQSAVGSNTIIPGYTEGPLTVHALEPAPAADAFTSVRETSSAISFADVGAGEKRRLASIVRTSPTTGYYVDIFRSDQPDNDYVYHNLGDQLEVFDNTGRPLALSEAGSLAPAPVESYQFFQRPRRVTHDGAFSARWTISRTTPSITMDMWMPGAGPREIFQVDAPPTTLNRAVVPMGVNHAPETTPTLIVRQSGRSAATAPFVAVFEPYAGEARSVRSVSHFGSSDTFIGIAVESCVPGDEAAITTDLILNAVDDAVHTPAKDIGFRGIYGVISKTDDSLREIYLGRGNFIRSGQYQIDAIESVSAGLVQRDGELLYSASGPVVLTLPHKTSATRQEFERSRVFYRAGETLVEASCKFSWDARTITASLPAGYNVPLTIAPAGSVGKN